jgi:hypothetical protein
MRTPPLSSLRRALKSRGRWRCLWLAAALAIGLCAAENHAQTARPQPQSCSLPGLTPSSGHIPTEEELLTAYNAQARLILSLDASVILHGQDETELNGQMRGSRPVPAMLAFRLPASVRMTGMVPFASRRSFDLASDGREFRLLVPEGNKMTFVVGPVDAPAASSDPRENIRPQMVLEAIRWLPAKLRGAASVNQGTSEIVPVALTTSAGSIVAAQFEFNLRSDTLKRLTMYDPAGKSTTVVDYNDWQSTPVAGEGSRPACFSRRMYIAQPGQNRTLEIKFQFVQLNVPIPAQRFRLDPPLGVKVKRVTPGEAWPAKPGR